MFIRRTLVWSIVAAVILGANMGASADDTGYFTLLLLSQTAQQQQQDSGFVAPPGATGYAVIDQGMFSLDPNKNIAVCGLSDAEVAHGTRGCWRKGPHWYSLLSPGQMVSVEAFLHANVGPEAKYISFGQKSDGSLLIFYSNSNGS